MIKLIWINYNCTIILIIKNYCNILIGQEKVLDMDRGHIDSSLIYSIFL